MALTFLLERARRLRTAGRLRGAVQILQTVVIAHILNGGQFVDAEVLVPVGMQGIKYVSTYIRRSLAYISTFTQYCFNFIYSYLKAMLSLK